MDLKQIPIEYLINGRYYLGRGRNGNIGIWNEKYSSFLVPSWKFSFLVEKYEGYYLPNDGCFQPFLLIDTDIDGEEIPNEDLIPHCEYIGKDGSVGCYDKKHNDFITVDKDFSAKIRKDFKPIKKIDEGKLKDKFEGYSEYGKTLMIGNDECETQ